MNVIIDACLLIDIAERKRINKKTVLWFSDFLKNGKEFNHIIIGTKMKKELLSEVNDKNYAIYNWYSTMTVGSNSIKKIFTNFIDNEDLVFDKKINVFKKENYVFFKDIEEELNDRIDDYHIIFAIVDVPINLFFSTDKRLYKVLEECAKYKSFKKINETYVYDRFFIYNKVIGSKFELSEERKMGYLGKSDFPDRTRK